MKVPLDAALTTRTITAVEVVPVSPINNCQGAIAIAVGGAIITTTTAEEGVGSTKEVAPVAQTRRVKT